MRFRNLRNAAFTRGLSALIATMMILSWRTATGSPGDIFTTAAPAIGDAPPAASAIADGESGVSTNTDAFTYSYPIAAPPGRNGMQPKISLVYSSQGATYGGIAAGWSLSGLPIITEDTAGGRLWRQATPAVPEEAPARYASSLAGNRPLVTITEPAPDGALTYRAQIDSTWVRYERYETGDYWWRALSPDGTIYYFGHKDSHTSSCSIVSDGYAPVTRIEDSFGNQVDFFYQAGAPGECLISEIRWGQNTSGAAAFARMTFTWSRPTPIGCAGPVGGQTSYRTGTKIVNGASELDTRRSHSSPRRSERPGTITGRSRSTIRRPTTVRVRSAAIRATRRIVRSGRSRRRPKAPTRHRSSCRLSSSRTATRVWVTAHRR